MSCTLTGVVAAPAAVGVACTVAWPLASVRESDQMFGLMGSTTQLAQATLSNTTSTDLIFPSHAMAE